MNNRTTTPQPLPFVARYELALEDARITYEARDGFISDDDILDISERWTTSTPLPEAEWDRIVAETGEAPDPWVGADVYRLRDELFAAIFDS